MSRTETVFQSLDRYCLIRCFIGYGNVIVKLVAFGLLVYYRLLLFEKQLTNLIPPACRQFG